MSKINVLRSIGILIGLAACTTACTPEEYGPCSIPNTKAHTVACSPTGASKTATCAVDFVFDCDSRICGIYDSSDAFCTHRCEPTISDNCMQNECESADKEYCKCPDDVKNCKKPGSCPDGGHCVEFIKGTSMYYCMPDDMYIEKGLDKKKASLCNGGTPATQNASTEEPEG